MSTMINTFHSSSNPPPVPPRPGHRGGPALPSNTPLVKFISVLLLLLMILTFGGFLYLFHRISTLQDRRSDNEINALKQLQQCAENLGSENLQHCNKLVELYKNLLKKVSEAEGKVALLIEPGSSTNPQARLVLSESKEENKFNTLVWKNTHSVLEKITLSSSGVLTIQYPGYYLIQSQVTFSKAHEKAPLYQAIWSQKAKDETPSELLKSFCSLPRGSMMPDLCTASETGVFRFEKGHKLFVNVTDKSLVNLATTTFGLFRLQD